MTDNALVVYTSPEQVRRDIEETMREQVAQVLPSRVDPDRFLRVVAKAVIGNPKLMECTRLSLLAAVHEAAQLGLEPSGLLGSAYLVPYRVKVKVPHPTNPRATIERQVLTAKLIPGYRGLIDLARRSGEILKVEARVVRARDVFLLDYGAPLPLIHQPYIPDPSLPVEERDPGPYVGAYMRAILRDDPVPQIEWMTYDEIAQVRRRSRAADDGPWTTDEPEMMRKTVVRRGSKYLPLTTDFRRALELDEEAERSASQPSESFAQLSRAQQMLIDRAAARDSDAKAGQSDEPSIDPGSTPDGALSQASPGGSDDGEGAVVEAETREVEAETRDEHEHVAKQQSPRAMEEGEPDVCETCGEIMLCGDTPPSKLDMTHPCEKQREHPGSHASDEGTWPRSKAKR